MKTMLILNPSAGSAAATEEFDWDRAGESCMIVRSKRVGHAMELARRAVREGYGRIIAAGGDGTINQVVNGIAPDFGAIELAIVPLGTGNDLSRSLDVPRDIAAALELALRGETRPIDVARFRGGGERYFLNVSAGGLAGAVDEHVTSEQKKRWGALAYVAGAAASVGDLAAHEATIEIDGRSFEASVYSVLVANGRFAGGGIPVAPNAKLDDGRFDVIVMPAGPLGETALAALQIVLGMHPESDHVVTLAAQRMRVHSAPPMPFNVDGESQGEVNASFELLPGALRIVPGSNSPGLTTR